LFQHHRWKAVVSKYSPLSERLKSLPGKEWKTTFGEIERLIGGRLPPVARKHRAWWSNNPVNSAITKAWLEAGFRTEQVSLSAETLVFRKREPDAESRRAGKPSGSLYGGLRGTVRLGASVELTEPTGEAWNASDGRL
jgi:hypothetical protein